MFHRRLRLSLPSRLYYQAPSRPLLATLNENCRVSSAYSQIFPSSAAASSSGDAGLQKVTNVFFKPLLYRSLHISTMPSASRARRRKARQQRFQDVHDISGDEECVGDESSTIQQADEFDARSPLQSETRIPTIRASSNESVRAVNSSAELEEAAGAGEQSEAFMIDNFVTHGGGRLDQVLLDALHRLCPGREWTRSMASGMIRDGLVQVDGLSRLKAGYKVLPAKPLSARAPAPAVPLEPVAEPEVPLDVLFENDHVCVLNKHAGIAVHPSPNKLEGTLVSALLHRYGRFGLSSLHEDASLRPGIVHRLDKETSGVMIVARTNAAHAILQRQFADHKTVGKIYTAIVVASGSGNIVEQDGSGGNASHRFLDATSKFASVDGTPVTHVIDVPLARHPRDINRMIAAPSKHSLPVGAQAGAGARWKDALTHFRVVRSWTTPARRKRGGKGSGILAGTVERFAEVEVEIFTGRTHQIRVHLASLGMPVVGDTIYHPRSTQHAAAETLMLAAKSLSIDVPSTGTASSEDADNDNGSSDATLQLRLERMTFTAALPPHMVKFVDFLDDNATAS